jgi:hypothetical protein
MVLIHVPKPPKQARDLNRPVSSLLKMQIEHLLEAERRLPVKHHSGIYVNAIKTEGEAAEYIRRVTEAIHRAHREAERARHVLRGRKRPIEIAAAAARPKGKSRTVAKKKTRKTRRKK